MLGFEDILHSHCIYHIRKKGQRHELFSPTHSHSTSASQNIATIFTHLDLEKWDLDHDGTIKNLILYFYLESWSRYHSLLRKIIEKPKIKMSTNQIQRFGSRLRVGKVLAPHNTRPKMVPLI